MTVPFKGLMLESNYCFTYIFAIITLALQGSITYSYQRKNLRKEYKMQCPICSNGARIEIVMHSDGYADNLLECASCGAVWINEFGQVTLLNKKVA